MAQESKDGPSGNGYVPPHLRNRDGGGEKEPEQQATLRVTNVSTEATRDDMHEIFRKYGPIARVSVPTDRVTGEGRGFAFIDYYQHADAARAIEQANRIPFEGLILKINGKCTRDSLNCNDLFHIEFPAEFFSDRENSLLRSKD